MGDGTGDDEAEAGAEEDTEILSGEEVEQRGDSGLGWATGVARSDRGADEEEAEEGEEEEADRGTGGRGEDKADPEEDDDEEKAELEAVDADC